MIALFLVGALVALTIPAALAGATVMLAGAIVVHLLKRRKP